MADLGMALSDTLFEHVPDARVFDKEAMAEASAALANLLGCIMAGVLLKYPDEYPAAIEAVIQMVHKSTLDTARGAVEMRAARELN